MKYITRLLLARGHLQGALLLTLNLLVLSGALDLSAEVVASANAAIGAWLVVIAAVVTGEGLDEIQKEIDRRVGVVVAAGDVGGSAASESAARGPAIAASFQPDRAIPTPAPRGAAEVPQGAPINRRA